METFSGNNVYPNKSEIHQAWSVLCALIHMLKLQQSVFDIPKCRNGTCLVMNGMLSRSMESIVECRGRK